MLSAAPCSSVQLCFEFGFSRQSSFKNKCLKEKQKINMVSKASPVSKRGSRIANSEASAVTDVVNDTSVVKTEYDQLCRELNMDTSTATAAWKSYSETRHKYILEVRQVHLNPPLKCKNTNYYLSEAESFALQPIISLKKADETCPKVILKSISYEYLLI